MTQKQDTITILAIESSCDDTAAAVIQDSKILANIVSSQEIHSQYGGVIPELASRAHQQHILPVVKKAIQTAGIKVSSLDAIAYTQGPGLMGSLLVGSHFAKGMSMALNIPSIGINHLQAHISALYLGEQKPKFPFICLLVSGGHTQIILVESHLKTSILGTTIDDAAGEAFDKTAKMLNLPYPGGPQVDKLAETGNPKSFSFPIAKVDGYNYSFSGLKTSLLYFLKKQSQIEADFIQNKLNDICASMRYTIVKTLLDKLEMAVKDHKITHISLAGGVSANRLLRKEFELLAKKNNWAHFIPAFEYCTDNAAMIAISAHYYYLEKQFSSLDAQPYARA